MPAHSPVTVEQFEGMVAITRIATPAERFGVGIIQLVAVAMAQGFEDDQPKVSANPFDEADIDPTLEIAATVRAHP